MFLRCLFDCEFEVLWIVQSRGTLNKIRCSVKILPFRVRQWRDVDYHRKGNSKHPGKLGILDLHIFPGLIHWYSFVVFACFLRKWRFPFLSFSNAFYPFLFYPKQITIYSYPVPWGVVSNNWVSCEVYQF